MPPRRVAVAIPAYNNAATVAQVVAGVLRHAARVIVVDDGSTDDTATRLAPYAERIRLVRHDRNKGKGAALATAFREAAQMGCDTVITLDADGQHFPDDLPAFLDAVRRYPDSIIIGNRFARAFEGEGVMNAGSRFANKFSNFWFAVQTGRHLDDTQTGYRAYPLRQLHGLGLLTARYEAELELLVFAAWHGTDIQSIPVRVYYPPAAERVSHFRPAADFARISVLNTVLCLLVVGYVLPRKLLRIVLAAAVAVGLFVWGVLLQACAFCFFTFHKATREQRLDYHRVFQWIARLLLSHVPGVRVRTYNPSGEDFSQPAVVVCNHQSQLDLLCVMALTPRVVIVTKRWVWHNPVYGTALRYADYLPISHVLDNGLVRLRELVAEGYSVVMFPEGTRSETLEVGRFHAGAFHIARELGLPVVPIVLHGTGRALHKHAHCFTPGDIDIAIMPRQQVAGLPDGAATWRSAASAWARHFRAQFRTWTQTRLDL